MADIIINPNTFQGSNQGTAGGYAPLSLIESAKVDADLTQILNDLNTRVGDLQNIVDKLNSIDDFAADDQTAIEIAALINASAERIDVENLEATVAEISDITSAIATHRATTVPGDMHEIESIKKYPDDHDFTPTSIINTPVNIASELSNIRVMIDKIIGSTTWVDTPADTITSLDSRVDELEEPVLQGLNIRSVSVNTTIDINSDYLVEVDANVGAITITLPTAASADGKVFNIKKTDVGPNIVSVDGAGAELVDGLATYDIYSQYESVTVISNGTEWRVI